MKYANKTDSKNSSIFRLLKHYLKNQENGFTLWELFVTIIIVGVLAAVSLPNLLTCTGKPRETEGKNAVGTLSRAQQAYHFENNTFSPDLTESQLQTKNDLDVIIPESEYYNFSVETTPTVAYALSIPKNAEGDGVRSYSSATFFDGKYNYQTIMCQSDEIIEKPTKPVLADGVLTCPENMTEIH